MNCPYYFVLIILILFSCKSNDNVAESGLDNDCNISAQVEDYSALDGCRKILITQSGDKILPMDATVLSSYPVKSNLMIGYKKVEGAASSCMAEDFIAEIICIQKSNIPMPKECIDAHTLPDLWWENISAKRDMVISVSKYSFLGDGWSYIIALTDGSTEVYNCQGDLLCSFEEYPSDHCRQMMSEMTYLRMIYGEVKKAK